MSEKAYAPRWTPEEDEALRMHYPSHGPRWDGWETLLPQRCDKSVCNRAHKLGVRMQPKAKSESMRKGAESRRAGRWTHEEDAAITRLYPRHTLSWDGWERALPGRTKAAIQRRACALGVGYRGSRPFTKAERARLLKVVLQLSNELFATPRDVAMELVELGREYERQAVS